MRAVLPGRLDAAMDALAGDPGLVPLAGGTDLLVHWPVRTTARDADYLDLTGLDELRPIRWEEGTLVLGALSTYWDAIVDPRIRSELPLLIDAARQVGAVQIQSRGTWAGNVINGSPAADGVPVLMAYGATVVLASTAGRREVPLDAFYTGYRETVRRPDELVVEIRVPRGERPFEAFVKVGPRRAQSIAKVGLAMARDEAGWRVAVASVAPVVKRCPAVETLLDGGGPLAGPEDLQTAFRQDVAPIDDLRSTAEYRERVLARVAWHALRDGGAIPD
ncbi:MAG TPA: FAD binding domain-containing protein [Gemmatimonadota bacterium]|nr:FAD binding domain-containing protein [Gemmatimonadota bacterium]